MTLVKAKMAMVEHGLSTTQLTMSTVEARLIQEVTMVEIIDHGGNQY